MNPNKTESVRGRVKIKANRSYIGVRLKIFGKETFQSINDHQLRELAAAFNINYRKGIID